MRRYGRDFYREIDEGSRRSAEAIVPLLLELTRPRSVIDVGCGLGTWLGVFRGHGIEDILGIDGGHVDRRMLRIPAERFLAMDLEKPVGLDRQFDLVICLEVAEHLPPACAEAFIEFLVGLGPAVVFSAAIPFQRGTHHTNERWPDYWTRCFHQAGYLAVDCIRHRIWDNESVEWWYAQNILLFARPGYLESHPGLLNGLPVVGAVPLSVVHPRNYLAKVDPRNRSRWHRLAALPILVFSAARNALRR